MEDFFRIWNNRYLLVQLMDDWYCRFKFSNVSGKNNSIDIFCNCRYLYLIVKCVALKSNIGWENRKIFFMPNSVFVTLGVYIARYFLFSLKHLGYRVERL